MEKSFYLERLPGLKEKFSVKIISGVRGAGKTTLLKNFAETLRAQGVAAEEIIFIDCAENPRPKDFQQLYGLVEEKTLELDKFYLLADEIDRVDEWEKAINALFVGAPAEIYVTGSSDNLSEKIHALLPDNCDVLKMYPLSFAECESVMTQEDYLHFGGMPAAVGADKKFIPAILRGICYEIFFDIAEKNFLNDAALIPLLAKYLARLVGSAFNLKECCKSLGASEPTLRNYLNNILEAGIFKKIPRLAIKSESAMVRWEKIYCIDNGILSALAEVDENILAENAVYVELLRRGFSVSTGRFGQMPVTFVAESGGKKIFIQVLPSDGEISARRITRPLREMPEDATKILISANPVKNIGDVENITLRDFLAGK